jgi:hypothetical protein
MKKSEALRRSVKVIQDLGWTRGEYQNEHGVCFLGAVSVVETNPQTSIYVGCRRRGWGILSTGTLTEAIMRDMYELGRDIPDWNDHIAQSPDEIIEAMKLLAEAYELQGQ